MFFFVWSGALYEVFVCFRSFCIHRPWWMVFSVPQSPNWPSRNYPQFFSWKTHSAICNNQKPSETIQHVEIYNQKSFLSPTDIYDFNKFRHAICVFDRAVAYLLDLKSWNQTTGTSLSKACPALVFWESPRLDRTFFLAKSAACTAQRLGSRPWKSGILEGNPKETLRPLQAPRLKPGSPGTFQLQGLEPDSPCGSWGFMRLVAACKGELSAATCVSHKGTWCSSATFQRPVKGGTPSHSPMISSHIFGCSWKALYQTFLQNAMPKEAPSRLEEQGLRIRQSRPKINHLWGRDERAIALPHHALTILGRSWYVNRWLRVEFLMLQKNCCPFFFYNPRSWNFSYRAKPQHWGDLGSLRPYPKRAPRGATPKISSPLCFQRWRSVTMQLRILALCPWRPGCLKIEKISGVSRVSSVLGIGWECGSLDGAAEDRESSGWGLGKPHPLALVGSNLT